MVGASLSHVAVDLDGTLLSWSERAFEPNALRVLRSLHADGVKLILHTCRTQMPGGDEEIELLLATHQLKRLDIEVWRGEGKPVAAAYVDDRGVSYRKDWLAAEREIRWLLANRPEEHDPSERP